MLTQTVDVTTGALSGTGVYLAANGDELAFTFTGTAELSFTDPTDATVTFEAVQDLSGGTGRFAAADGTVEVAGTTRLNLITGSGTGELTLDGAGVLKNSAWPRQIPHSPASIASRYEDARKRGLDSTARDWCPLPRLLAERSGVPEG
jgi:hypothetical protein